MLEVEASESMFHRHQDRHVISEKIFLEKSQSPSKVVASLCATPAKNLPLCRRTRDVFAKRGAVARSKFPKSMKGLQYMRLCVA